MGCLTFNAEEVITRNYTEGIVKTGLTVRTSLVCAIDIDDTREYLHVSDGVLMVEDGYLRVLK